MKNSSYKLVLNQLSENAFNKYPVSIPCLIFKDEDTQTISLDSQKSIIDKDVLSQIIYELLKYELDGCIPIVISLEDHSVNHMEGKGVYILDDRNNKFIYLFGDKDQIEFFETIYKIKEKANISTSLMIGYLCEEENKNKEYPGKLNKLMDLHGSIFGESTFLDHTEEIKFPLLKRNMKLNVLSWIYKNEEAIV